MEWIRTEERLPRLRNGAPVEVIVAIYGAQTATTLFFDGTCFADEEGVSYRVTHWMPLPEIPECQWKKRMIHVFLHR